MTSQGKCKICGELAGLYLGGSHCGWFCQRHLPESSHAQASQFHPGNRQQRRARASQARREKKTVLPLLCQSCQGEIMAGDEITWQNDKAASLGGMRSLDDEDRKTVRHYPMCPKKAMTS